MCKTWNLEMNEVADKSKINTLMPALSEILTARQIDCAHLLMQGKSAKEIGLELNLSARTIERHIELVKKKLKCRNKTELIIKLTEYIAEFNN